MIISPNALVTTNILHAVNNAYKCTDEVYMFSQSKEDCHHYFQRAYWARDPEDSYEPPNFLTPTRNLLLIRDDLVGLDPDSTAAITSQTVPYLTTLQNGYGVGCELTSYAVLAGMQVQPIIRPVNSIGSLNVEDVFWWFALTRSYFAPQWLRLFRGTSSAETEAMTPGRMAEMNFISAIATRLQFGEERKVHAVLFYRPRLGRTGSADSTNHSVQLLRLPEYSTQFEKVFDSVDSKEFTEPEEDVYQRITIHSTQYPLGIPCAVNLDTPITEKELYLRWSGLLTHFQLLDSPLLKLESWTLADNPGMTYSWPHLEDKILAHDPRLVNENMGQMKYAFQGDFSAGIRFAHPLRRDIAYNSGSSGDTPYADVDYYTAKCLTSTNANYEVQEVSDIWELQGFRDDDYSYDSSGWFNQSIFARQDPDTGELFHTRDVGDNQFYVANKSLLKWYYSPETNSWKSNHTRPSMPDQLRFLLTFSSPQYVRGCLNPMSVPAIFNKPTFFMRTGGSLPFQFEPGVYGDWLVPHRVLIEGRVNNSPRTKWELLDEFTLSHFSTRAHAYFSYPQRVRYIRITIQDWYGNSLMDDIRNDYFHHFSGNSWETPTPGRHYDEYSHIYANYTLRGKEDYTIGRCLDTRPTIPTFSVSSPDFAPATEEWQRWKARTVQSLWKGIYIPPFLFFGDNGEK